ncbi:MULTISPECIES: MGMT family protein [unclassified Paenibacillus]|uniref:MGMT family protein n=1 Tax=unclassified Paenibacillus TaxID=185978 RepID=UPI0009AE9524|nr:MULTISPECIES: MGMT family protein [unclassified Paenibacillus]MBE1445544.1 methylated-DNA-protein-cysteine methyltransferase-like protein [Paenibacillus sp. OAS669]
MTPFTRQVIEIIKAIPEGHVMTYGQIAELAGSRRAARQVVRILHSSSKKYNLPWYRVVNAKGEIGLQGDEARFLQIMHLQNEGVAVDDEGKMDLTRWQYHPEE